MFLTGESPVRKCAFNPEVKQGCFPLELSSRAFMANQDLCRVAFCFKSIVYVVQAVLFFILFRKSFYWATK
ncbi:hypothetical protein HYN43_002455 [Mucilaginibacter celer]|uniref:Uncharacterized protein n=1 Tax=Mucilaginibacter celer TaxID=2305508 RepID=A0A494VJ07_9SPHI|nr:hypothetical protein HYN43_002455 [Mucilaginibacter celer]